MHANRPRLIDAVSPLALHHPTWPAMLRSILVLAVLANAAGAQVLNLAELSAEQIRALDRAKTVVLLPGGILEEHGPHLPSYTDGYQNERMTSALARAVAARPGWKALVFPMIPLGTGGANEIGGKFSWPGTYSVRTTTLRAVFMDLADELGEQGFRWAFIINGHGAPRHNRALDEVEDYFRDTYGGRMVHLSGRNVDMAAHEAEYRRHITPAIRQPTPTRRTPASSIRASWPTCVPPCSRRPIVSSQISPSIVMASSTPPRPRRGPVISARPDSRRRTSAASWSKRRRPST